MKKNARTLIILGAVLVICIGAYIAVSIFNRNQAAKTAEEATAAQIYANGRSAPSNISYESGGITLSFALREGTWQVADSADFPLNQSSLTSLASAVNGLTAVRTIDLSSPLSTYGLDQPAYRVTASDTAGNALTLLIGAQYEDYYYAMAEGGDKIYTISSSLVGYLKTDLLSMIMLDTIPVLGESSIDVIRLSSGTATLTLDKHLNKDGTYTWFIVEGAAYTAADEYALPEAAEKTAEKYVGNAVKAMSSVKFTSCAVFKPTAEELASYGLDTALATVTVEYTTTSGTGLESTSGSGTAVISIGRALDDGTGYYASLPGSQQINVLPAAAVDPLIEALGAMGTGA
jgi:hypothetical protein